MRQQPDPVDRHAVVAAILAVAVALLLGALAARGVQLVVNDGQCVGPISDAWPVLIEDDAVRVWTTDPLECGIVGDNCPEPPLEIQRTVTVINPPRDRVSGETFADLFGAPFPGIAGVREIELPRDRLVSLPITVGAGQVLRMLVEEGPESPDGYVLAVSRCEGDPDRPVIPACRVETGTAGGVMDVNSVPGRFGCEIEPGGYWLTIAGTAPDYSPACNRSTCVGILDFTVVIP